MHRQVCRYIRQWIDDNVLNHISAEKNAQTLQNKLEQLYVRKIGDNKLFLIKNRAELQNLSAVIHSLINLQLLLCLQIDQDHPINHPFGKLISGCIFSEYLHFNLILGDKLCYCTVCSPQLWAEFLLKHQTSLRITSSDGIKQR